MMTRVAPIGNKIAQLRRERGIKQAVFAKEIGVSESTLRKIETRDYSVPRKTLDEIANKLKVDVTEVLQVPQFMTTTAAAPTLDDQIEVRPVSSKELMELLRWPDQIFSEMHIDVTREMLSPIRTILEIAELFKERRATSDVYVFARHDPSWHSFPELYASAEITEALSALQTLGVAVLANKKYQRSEGQRLSERHVYISFEKTGVTSRSIEICPF